MPLATPGRAPMNAPNRRPLCLGALALLSGCRMGDPECARPRLPADGRPPDLWVLSCNVGNTDTSDPRYALRIKVQAYEDHLGAGIRRLRPHIVGLQEVLPPTACGDFEESDSARTCYQAAERPSPVRRLLGPEYSIACDARRHVECIGVHVDFGTIRGIEPGGLRIDGAETAALPLPACEHDDCRGDRRECDAASAITTVVVDTNRGPLRVIHVHPTAIGNQCRQLQIEQAFTMVGNGPALLLGDWNFDPERTVDIVEASIWNRFVGPTRRFLDHSPRDRGCRALRSSVSRDLAIDRVASDFALGVCEVLSSPPIDDGFDLGAHPDVVPLDHHAVYCRLFDER